MLPQAPSGFSNYKTSKKLLVGAVGIDLHPSLLSLVSGRRY